jgi:RHS repeat-associated protein
MINRASSGRTSSVRRNVLVLAVILAVAAFGLSSPMPAGPASPAADSETMVTTPDHPEGASFDPNEIKDIKAADPGAKINLIAPPTANNMGDARLSYPLEVPPGRAGLEPELAVAYSSAAGNSWTGMGWELATPAITIETRWGVPRYELAQETETYLLNGEQLTPVAHRAQPQARTAEKVFHSRVEGRFDRIVRHGDSPTNYWWEVTSKSGKRMIFGGAADTTLTDARGNIASWVLREIRDTNDNFVSYHYARVDDGGVANATVPGSNLYPQRIAYTGHGTTEGRYSVTFTRDRERGEPRRADVQIDARGGFKKVTADLLRRVEVKLDDQLIRAYELNYHIGAFAKTLLASVSQFGEDNRLFNTHSFDYYDDIRDQAGNYDAFGTAGGWTIADDNLGANVPDGEAGALSASTSRGGGGHLYVGYNPTSVNKSNSAGVKVGFNAGSSDGLLALADVNGDNLPDKVFRSGGGVFYRPNLSGPGGQSRFGDTPIPLTNLPAISTETSRSRTIGIESYFGVAAQLDHVSTTTTSDRYFIDVNGDGITDLVNNGGVLFGHLDANGNPAYSANSQDTPAPVGTGAVSGVIVGNQAAEFERAVDASPLLDSVRRWVAPFDGTVRVDGRVRLVPDTSPERAAYRKADGVRVTIQHQDTELWAQRIGPEDYFEFEPTGVSGIPVRKGDAIYFRVQSVLDGLYDTVAWDPRISYVGVPAGTDVNGLDNVSYLASRDFTLGGRPSVVTAPLTGTLHLSGDAIKTGPTTDDVTVVITRNGTEVFTHTLARGGAGTAAVDLDIPVTANDTLSWRLRADSPIDAGTLRWVPRAHYTQAEGVDGVLDPAGNPALVIEPPYDLDMYPVNTLTAAQGFHPVAQDGQLTVQPSLSFDFGGQAPDTRVVFTVKKRGVLLAKRVIDIVDGQLPAPESMRVTVDVAAGDELFFDLATLDTALLPRLTGQSVSVSQDGAAFTTAPSALHASAEQGAFAQPYRGWAAIGYQANRDRATRPIAQNELVLDESYRNSLPDGPTEADVPGFTADPRVDHPRIVVFAPLPGLGRWAGGDDNTWVAAGTAASSRLGLDTIDVATDADFAGATGVSRRSRNQQISTTFGASIPGVPIGAGASVARGDSSGEVDFLDLNGDRFPDAAGSGGVQYSDMIGGLGGKRGSLDGKVRESDSTAFTVSANAGSPARTSSTARGQDAPAGNRTATTAKSGVEMPALGVGGSLGGGESGTDYDLIDVNGDGLPDKVFDNGEAALNLGYSFATPEPWQGAGLVNDGETRNAGVNLGFNTSFYGFAGGVSASLGSSVTDASLMDMNGDGLLDRVFTSEGNPVGVAINTGSRFADPTPFRGSLTEIAADENASLGGGVYFTFGFCFVFGCIVFNPGADVSTGLGRAEIGLRDVNGDGYVDHVRSTSDNELVVAANRTGRTNLLRSVSRPLGGRIDLDYTRTGNTSEQPESRWVMSRSALFDGHPGDGQDVALTTFRYQNGHYDRLERQFNGFGQVVTEQRDAGNGEAVYRTVSSDYLTDSYYTRGLLASTVTADGAGRRFQETAHTYQLRDVATGAAADPASTTATVFPQLARTDKRFYEGQATAGKSTFEERSYDEFGNVTRLFEAADAGGADDLETRFAYTATDQACRDRHIVDQANFIQQRGTSPENVLRHRESTVDCGNGDVRQVREFLAGGTAAVTDLEYFTNGNLRTVIGPANRTGQRYRLDYEYDTVVGVHVESIVDSFGYRSTTTHSIKYGEVETTTDQNNQRLSRTYDTVGRLDTVAGPYELAENRLTIDFSYHPDAAVPHAVTRHVDRTATGVRADTLDTVLFTDGLKRVLQTKKDASVATTAGADPQPVMTVSGRTTFDFVGRLVEQFFPVTEPKGAANTTFNASFDTVAPTRLAFDVLDRPLRTELPDGTVSTLAYGFGPDRSGTTQFEKIATDANGKQRRSFADIRELTTSVKEFNPAGGQPVIWTSYGYDPLGQLTSVVDDRNNTTSTAYDNLGRRTIVDSPDAGRTETRYDLADNVIAKITAKLSQTNQAIEYDYDYNRLAGIRYPVFPGNNVTYTYGGPGAPNNTADRVAEVVDAAGTVSRQYGPLGELTRETRTVTAINQPPRTYTTSWSFDAFNRVLALTYPDGEVLTYEYDSGGQVNRATGVKGGFDYTYLARLDYDKFGQRLLQETGTGVRTTYAYDPADRQLSNLKSRLPDGHHFQDITYGYDNVGNITTLTNTVPLPHGKPIGGPNTQTFGYDDLYRLTSAAGQYTYHDNKLDRYSLSLGYDTIHNTVAKSQLHEIVVNPGPSSMELSSYDQGSPDAGQTGGTFGTGGTLGTGGTGGTLETGGTSSTGGTSDTGGTGGTEPAPGTDEEYVYLPPIGAIEPEDETVSDPETGGGEQLMAAAGTDTVQVQRKTTYDYGYTYASGKPHAPSRVGPLNQAYDANGNLIDSINTLPPAPGKRRQLVWDEENRLACNQDHSRNRTVPQDPSTCSTPQQPPTVRYVYDDDGNRVIKRHGALHIYPNRNFSERAGTGFKHVFIGETRIATKTVKPDSTYENHQFFFHTDHLGSSSYVTDEHANLTEHLEYFAFGETWVNEHPAQPTPVPYQYGAKEFDEETGFYYFGARYYNPRTNLWQSPDPALPDYLDGAHSGGVHQPFNLAPYTYSHNNPVKLTDPDGEAINLVAAAVGAAAGAVVGAGAYAAVQAWRGEKITLRGAVAAGAGGAVSGAAAGFTMGGSLIVQAGAAVAGGAVGGAAGGAVTAAVNGEDVGQGALQGAAVGAVAGPLGMAAGRGAQALLNTVIRTGLAKSGALRAAAVAVHDLATPAIRHRMSTVALAEVNVPGVGKQIFASASGGRMSAEQVEALIKMGVPASNIVRGTGHAEMNIINALPPGAKQLRWGIAWAGGNKPIPCTNCAPHVEGIIEGAP